MLHALATAPWYGPGPGPGFPFFFLGPLVWLVVLALLFVLVGRRRRRIWAENGGPSSGPHRSPESRLSERFANGEIEEVEYRSRLEVLRANRPAPRR